MICLKNGEKREAEYEYMVRALVMADEYFLGQSLTEASVANALYVSQILRAKFFNLIKLVTVYQDGKKVYIFSIEKK